MANNKQILSLAIQGGGTSTLVDLAILNSLLQVDTGITMEPVSEDDTCLRLEWLKSGKIDLMYEDSYSASLVESSLSQMASRSRGPLQMRIVASAHSGAVGMMVRADSRLRTTRDIDPTTRFAVAAGTGEMVHALLAWLTDDSKSSMAEWPVKAVPFDTWEASQWSIERGTADVALAAPENPVVKEIATRPPGIRFLDLSSGKTPEGMARFNRFVPQGQLIPAPHHGVKEIWDVISWVGTACLWCRYDFDFDTAYILTRWFDKNYDRFKDRGNKLVTYSREAMRETLDVAVAPVHPGTVKYLKEIGMWYPKDDVRQEYNQKLMDWYCAAWDETLRIADEQGVEVSSASRAWVNLWAEHKLQIGIPKYRQLSDDEVREALRLISKRGPAPDR